MVGRMRKKIKKEKINKLKYFVILFSWICLYLIIGKIVIIDFAPKISGFFQGLLFIMYLPILLTLVIIAPLFILQYKPLKEPLSEKEYKIPLWILFRCLGKWIGMWLGIFLGICGFLLFLKLLTGEVIHIPNEVAIPIAVFILIPWLDKKANWFMGPANEWVMRNVKCPKCNCRFEKVRIRSSVIIWFSDNPARWEHFISFKVKCKNCGYFTLGTGIFGRTLRFYQ